MTNSCTECGVCCKLFYINLSQKEYESGQYQTIFQSESSVENFNQAKSCGANFLAKKADGGCIYLVDNKCSIHTIRPKVCHPFFCTSQNKKFKSMIEIIKSQNL